MYSIAEAQHPDDKASKDAWGDAAAFEQLIEEMDSPDDLDYLAKQEGEVEAALRHEVGRVATFVETADRQIVTLGEANSIVESGEHGSDYPKGRRA